MATKNRGRRRPNWKNAERSTPSKSRGRHLADAWRRVPEFTNEDGHVYVSLIDDRGLKVDRMLAELVLEAFVAPKPSPQHQAHHRNGERRDNRLINLEWRSPTIVPEPSDN